MDNFAIEPKPLKITNPLAPVVEQLAIAIRKKRSAPKQMESFSIMDMFSGDGIFSQLPQLAINLFGFFSNLFPSGGGGGGNSDYETPDEEPYTEPQAEVITPATKTPATSPVVLETASKLREMTTPYL